MGLFSDDKQYSPQDLLERALDEGKIRYALQGLAQGANAAYTDSDKKTLLMLGAFKKSTPTSMLLLDQVISAGVNLDAQDREGNTALHAAGNNKNIDAALKLLAAGADPEVHNRQGITAAEFLCDKMGGAKKVLVMEAIFNARAAKAEQAGYEVVAGKKTNNKPHIKPKA